MNRRDFNLLLPATSTGFLINPEMSSAQTPPASQNGLVFAMPVHPKIILLDLIGLMTMSNMTMGKVHLVCKDTTPVRGRDDGNVDLGWWCPETTV
ncbi:hypothetical protein [Neorhizobium petrolearium]|uniref:hypothetical protein n=1 Tax=Neorhizobium petrolearium TaxID=515361 RepID=UPI003F15B92A